MEDIKTAQAEQAVSAYWKRYCVKKTVSLMRQDKQAVARIIKEADRLMEQVFAFEDPWDMEPCQTPWKLDPMVWDQSPNGDMEWVYMLNRHGYLYKLLVAYWLTEDKAYVERLKWYLFHWISHNPILLQGGETIRTIDTGIRCMNWVPLLVHLLGDRQLTGRELKLLLRSLKEQFLYLKNAYVGKYSLSNWGVLQTTAVCLGYLWFGTCFGDREPETWALTELRCQLNLQVLEDGSHWEQSIMYHIEVLNACTSLLTGYGDCGKPAPDWLFDAVMRMNRYVMHAAGPDHMQQAQGDSDVTDVRDVLTRGALLCRDGELKYCGYRNLDLENLWLFGAEGADHYRDLPVIKPTQCHASYPDSGNIYMRSSWEENASYTWLTNGPLGSSHGHVDLTHLSLYHQGKPYLVDSGRYSYMEEEPLRPLLKSAMAHNVCVIDGQPHGKPSGSWGYESYGDCLKNYDVYQKPFHYAEAAYTGQAEDGTGYLVKHQVLAADPDIWMVVNQIQYKGLHSMKEYYHLDENVIPERFQTSWRLKQGNDCLMLSGDGEFELHPCTISKRYNKAIPGSVLVKQTHWIDRTVDVDWIVAEGIQVRDVPVYQYHSKTPASQDLVTAREFRLSSEESFLFLVFHRETFRGGKVFYCQGIPVYGKVVILHRRSGHDTQIRLRN